MKTIRLIFIVLAVITIFAIVVSAQLLTGSPIWDNPNGKVNFNHTHDMPAAGADNDWLFSGSNNIYRTLGTVAIGSFPGTVAELSKLYVKNGPGNSAAQRIEHTGVNVIGLLINPISGATGPSLWANGRGRFDALVVGSVAGNNVAFNPGSGNLQVENDIIVDSLAGSGNGFACIDSNGKLFRSSVSCAQV